MGLVNQNAYIYQSGAESKTHFAFVSIIGIPFWNVKTVHDDFAQMTNIALPTQSRSTTTQQR